MAKRAPNPLPLHPFDRQHGTDTSGLIPGTSIATGTRHAPEDLTAYYAIAPSILQSLLDMWLQRMHPTPIENTVFYDVGAGKGRALLVASQYPFRRVEGVELNPRLAEIARDNIRRWLSDPGADELAPLELHEGDATLLPLPDAPCCVFMFHPFEERLLHRFLQHVEKCLTARPHMLDVLYANAEHTSVIEAHPAFSKLWEGRVAMSSEDHLADLEAIAQQKEYGSTGDEVCAIFRFVGRGRK